MVASPPVVAGRRARAAIQRPVDSTSDADRLHSAAIHLLRRLRRTDPLTGISAAQLSVLSVLLGGRRTIGELATAEQVQPPTMSRLVREMESAGLVARARDQDDGRVVWISSTAAGAQLLAQGRELRVATLARQIAALPPADRAALLAGLDVLERVLGSL
jgi:DNA-binding MarR family transcriptional regulator